jgi:hypothetical protein
MTTTKKPAAKSNTPKAATPSKSAAGRGVGKAAADLHLSKLQDIHPELRAMVNKHLKSKGIPLQLHAIHFVDEGDDDDSHCCKINGKYVCGPQCH